MCGIVGYVGGKDVESNLLSALKLLEYRGYDSAGIAVLDSCGNVETIKEVGRLTIADGARTDPILQTQRERDLRLIALQTRLYIVRRARRCEQHTCCSNQKK